MRSWRILCLGTVLVLLAFLLPAAAGADKGDGVPIDERTEEEPVPEGPDWQVKGDVLILCKKKDATITVPEGIREIAPYAFKELTTLKKVILPDTVEKISEGAFSECVNLRKVSLTENSRLKEIGKKAFLNCKQLDISFVPPEANVADNAFQGVQTEPEEEPTPQPPHGWGGGPSVQTQPHAPNTAPSGPDYDQVEVDKPDVLEEETMDQLTLGGEKLELTLTRKDGGNSGFTVSTMHWQEQPEDSDETQADTLILTAVGGEDGTGRIWKMNGSVLRRIHKSGIVCLVLQTGDQVTAMETGGFLAGWAYDELRSRGTANRRFEYEIEMSSESPAVWHVQVEGQSYALSDDPHAPIYLRGAVSGPAETLNQRYDQVFTVTD